MLVGAPNGDDGPAAGKGGGIGTVREKKDGMGGKKRRIFGQRGLEVYNSPMEATTGPKKRGEIRPVEKHHMMLDKEQMGTG